MTPNEHDDPAKSEELLTTELYPFAPVTPGGPDDTMPDLPVMEQLPDSQALPDPGYPEMPASAGEHAVGTAPPHGAAEEPSAGAGPPPPEPLPRPPFQPFPPPRPVPLPHAVPPPHA